MWVSGRLAHARVELTVVPMRTVERVTGAGTTKYNNTDSSPIPASSPLNPPAPPPSCTRCSCCPSQSPHRLSLNTVTRFPDECYQTPQHRTTSLCPRPLTTSCVGGTPAPRMHPPCSIATPHPRRPISTRSCSAAPPSNVPPSPMPHHTASESPRVAHHIATTRPTCPAPLRSLLLQPLRQQLK